MSLTIIARTGDAPFNGMWLTLARHSRGLSLEDLAEMVDSTPDALASIEADETRPTSALLAALAETLDYPLNLFQQADPPDIIWHDHHENLERCECGVWLGKCGERMPLVCPDCMDPTYGCPCCDADMHVDDRKDKATGEVRRRFVCKQCGYKATVAEMMDLWEKGRLR